MTTQPNWKDNLDPELIAKLEQLNQHTLAMDQQALLSYQVIQQLLNSSDEAATLTLQIGNLSVPAELIHIDIISMFDVFLSDAIRFLEGECAK